MRPDEGFMREAMREACKGLGRTHPNPAVGAVIVSKGRIIARGWHRGAGLPHAEIEALRRARGAARGSTLYVTLEPCSTQGRTPPCTEAIRQAGIARVVYGATDPNPKHAGRATGIFSDYGIEVCLEVLGAECAALNPEWNKWIATGMPYVIAKAAMTLDGRINSPPDSRWISSKASRRDAMKLRRRVDAILVGGGTIRADDPQLTVRGISFVVQPLRVVWTRSGRLPREARIFNDEYRDRTMVFRGRSLRSALRELGRQGVLSVLIEGGARLLGEAFDRSLVDEVCFYLSPMLSGGPVPSVGGRGAGDLAGAVRLDHSTFQLIGSDVKLSAVVLKK
ncbi:MAG TPA: bifunctional diaminohydroxyphosphoribosylaminopyrimidine deaminase/5-amino-6-(5-phosphoribosylamino)uracil reductase RibD [Terrimicrobiaceae bacterium]|nr:bifunctional diaminohydroxyphosphoribosylaminopyrimidine deaminase/5-amino-6-(5-phosphoribosylamino)uracil reductase RibD [Terrimicrobiaceae bacterium]